MLDRRALIKLGLYRGSGALLHLTRLKSGAWAWALDEDDDHVHGVRSAATARFPAAERAEQLRGSDHWRVGSPEPKKRLLHFGNCAIPTRDGAVPSFTRF
jgi:hypothetical protein